MSATLARTFSSLEHPELPALLRRPGDLDHRQLDADRRRDVADGAADRLGRRRRPRRRAAVPPDPAVRRLGRPAGRPPVQAAPADLHAALARRPGAGAVRAGRDRRGRAVDGAGADPRARFRGGDRQPGAAVVRGRDRRPGPRRERGRAELRRRPLLAHPRPGRRRHDHRAGRDRALFRRQRGLVPGHVRRAAHDEPTRAAHAQAGRAQARRAQERPALRARHARAADPAGDDGAGRHDLVQLPGPAAAAGRLHLERDRRRPTRC